MVRHLALRLYVCDHRPVWPDRFRAGTVPVSIFCDAQSGGGEEIYISRLPLGCAHWHGRRDGPPKSHDRRQQRKFAELPHVLWHRPSHSGGTDKVFGEKVKTKTFAPRRRGGAERNRNLPRIDADERGFGRSKNLPLIGLASRSEISGRTP